MIINNSNGVLNTTHALTHCSVGIVKVGHNGLNFLASLSPSGTRRRLTSILRNRCVDRGHFLLRTRIYRRSYRGHVDATVGRIILRPNGITRVVRFRICVSRVFTFSRQSSKLVVSAPANSATCSLSTNNPVLAPSLSTVALIPVFPRALSTQPLIVGDDDAVHLHFSRHHGSLRVDYSDRVTLPVRRNRSILVHHYSCRLGLVRPGSCDCFGALDAGLN